MKQILSKFEFDVYHKCVEGVLVMALPGILEMLLSVEEENPEKLDQLQNISGLYTYDNTETSYHTDQLRNLASGETGPVLADFTTPIEVNFAKS